MNVSKVSFLLPPASRPHPRLLPLSLSCPLTPAPLHPALLAQSLPVTDPRLQPAKWIMPFLPPGITIKSATSEDGSGSAASVKEKDPPVGTCEGTQLSLSDALSALCCLSLTSPNAVVRTRNAPPCPCESCALPASQGRGRRWMDIPRRRGGSTRALRQRDDAGVAITRIPAEGYAGFSKHGRRGRAPRLVPH